MRSQRKSSLDVQLLGPHWFLSSTLCAVAVLVLPALSLDALLCNSSPLGLKIMPRPTTTTKCLPHQFCSNATGRYMSVHFLSAQGCVDTELCGSHEIKSYWWINFNISHTCCCEDLCNGRPGSDASPEMPSPNCNLLRCYYRPILRVGRDFESIKTVCPPGELCYTAVAHYWRALTLTARGCMKLSDCNQVRSIRWLGIEYSMRYTCCNQWYCNP